MVHIVQYYINNTVVTTTPRPTNEVRQRHHLEEDDATFIEISIELNHVQDPYNHFYITAKVHKNLGSPVQLSANVW